MPRKRLLDALTSNLSVLNASIAALLAGGGDADAATTEVPCEPVWCVPQWMLLMAASRLDDGRLGQSS